MPKILTTHRVKLQAASPSMKGPELPEAETAVKRPEHDLPSPHAGAKTAVIEDPSQEIQTTADDTAAEAIDARENLATGQDDSTAEEGEKEPEAAHQDPVWSVIPRRQRVAIILIVSFSGLFSPLTSAICESLHVPRLVINDSVL